MLLASQWPQAATVKQSPASMWVKLSFGMRVVGNRSKPSWFGLMEPICPLRQTANVTVHPVLRRTSVMCFLTVTDVKQHLHRRRSTQSTGLCCKVRAAADRVQDKRVRKGPTRVRVLSSRCSTTSSPRKQVGLRRLVNCNRVEKPTRWRVELVFARGCPIARFGVALLQYKLAAQASGAAASGIPRPYCSENPLGYAPF